MGMLLTVSDLLIPLTVLSIVVFGCLRRVDIYAVFLEGAREGLQTVLDILPTLIGLMVAVEVMRAGRLSCGAGAAECRAAGVFLCGNGASDRPFCHLWPGFLPRQSGLCYDELHRNGVLYDESLFSLCRYPKNRIYPALRPFGEFCRRACGGVAGAACLLRLDGV